MKRFLPACAALLCASSTLANSPYISRVFEYCPAPGQFVNELPEYTEGDTYQDILSKVTEQIAGDRTPGLITLGADLLTVQGSCAPRHQPFSVSPKWHQ